MMHRCAVSSELPGLSRSPRRATALSRHFGVCGWDRATSDYVGYGTLVAWLLISSGRRAARHTAPKISHRTSPKCSTVHDNRRSSPLCQSQNSVSSSESSTDSLEQRRRKSISSTNHRFKMQTTTHPSSIFLGSSTYRISGTHPVMLRKSAAVHERSTVLHVRTAMCMPITWETLLDGARFFAVRVINSRVRN